MYHVKKFITMLIMISFSCGFDSAIRSVRATKVLSDSIFLLFLYKIRFISRKYKNVVAAILLHPSTKG